MGLLDITIGDNDKNFIFGTATGGLIGGFLSQEHNYFSKLEKWSQGMWEDMTGKTAREAGKKAAQEAEKARRESIIKQFGERQQKDALAMANMRRSPGSNTATKGAMGTDSNGFIGGGLPTSAGTF